MIIDGAANLKFVYLEGEMTLKDIQNIMMYQNTSMNVGGNVYLYRRTVLLIWRIWAFWTV